MRLSHELRIAAHKYEGIEEKERDGEILTEAAIAQKQYIVSKIYNILQEEKRILNYNSSS
jgi:hypothetical protein